MVTSSKDPVWRYVMAGSALCVACAQLPIKDREVATRVRRCPECAAEVGVTSYGTRFRARPAKRGQLLTRSVILLACGGVAGLSALTGLLALLLFVRSEPVQPRPQQIVAFKPAPPVVQAPIQ